MIKCEACNKEFTPNRPGRAKWCNECKQTKRQEWNEAANKRRSERKAEARKSMVCLRCNQPLSARRNDTMYHKECAEAVRKEQQATWEKDHRLDRTLRMRKRRGSENTSTLIRPLEEYVCQTPDCGNVYLSQRGDSKYCDDCSYKRRLIRSSSYKVKAKYGITVDEFRELLERQDYKCKLCDRQFTSFPNFLQLESEPNGLTPHVDHDHHTSKVRGLLCSWCNTDLGHVENTEWLDRAKQYLESN